MQLLYAFISYDLAGAIAVIQCVTTSILHAYQSKVMVNRVCKTVGLRIELRRPTCNHTIYPINYSGQCCLLLVCIQIFWKCHVPKRTLFCTV